MTFTEEARTLYYEICERYGLTIDREVKNPSQKHKETLEHKCEMLEKEVQEKDLALEEMKIQLQSITREANKESVRYKENKIQAEKEEIRAVNNAELAEKLVKKKVKQNKDDTISIGLKQYQEATAIVQETKRVLNSEVYSPTERKEMQLAARELEREKARYRMAADGIEEQIERRAEEKANYRQHSEKHRIEKLEQELARERHDKNYICEMIKRFLPEAILERFEQFSGIILHNKERIRSHTR